MARSTNLVCAGLQLPVLRAGNYYAVYFNKNAYRKLVIYFLGGRAQQYKSELISFAKKKHLGIFKA